MAPARQQSATKRVLLPPLSGYPVPAGGHGRQTRIVADCPNPIAPQLAPQCLTQTNLARPATNAKAKKLQPVGGRAASSWVGSTLLPALSGRLPACSLPPYGVSPVPAGGHRRQQAVRPPPHKKSVAPPLPKALRPPPTLSKRNVGGCGGFPAMRVRGSPPERPLAASRPSRLLKMGKPRGRLSGAVFQSPGKGSRRALGN